MARKRDITLPMNVRPLKIINIEDESHCQLYDHLNELLDGWKNHRQVTVEHIWSKAYENFNGEFDEAIGETSSRSGKSWRSRAFYPLTEQKVTSAQAQLQDILFKGGKFPYDVKGSPIPDDPTMMAQITQANDGGAMVNPQMVQQMAMNKTILESRIKNMKKRLDDQFAECDAASVGLISIYDGALYGTAFLESPRVIRKKRYKWAAGKGKGYSKKEVYEDVPTVVNLNPWDCFYDPDCGGTVMNGLGFFHRQRMSEAGIQDLYSLVFPSKDIKVKDASSEMYDYEYNQEEFDALLKTLAGKGLKHRVRSSSEGPNDAEDSGHANKVFDVFNFAGQVPNRMLKKFIPDLTGGDNFYTEVIVVMCEQRVIKCVRNPFPGGRRPYHMVPWTKVPGSATGRGVAEKIFDAQQNVNKLMRMYIDNKRLSGNLMTAIDKSKLKSGESMEIYPGRNWEFEGAFQDADVRKLLQPIFFPDVTGGVLEAIGTMVQWADQSSGIPKILEGQPGQDSSTAYAENQRIASASKQLGLVLKNYDMHAWVPIVESFYDWNMEFLKDEDVKGDFSIIATGFATFENKHLRKLDLERLLLMSQQMGALQSKVKLDPVVEDWAIAGNIDPERYMFTPEEVSARSAQQQQENLQTQGAMMQMEQQKMAMEHQFEVELASVKGQISAETRMALAQINAQVKQMNDQTKRLTTMAQIESKTKEPDVRKNFNKK